MVDTIVEYTQDLNDHIDSSLKNPSTLKQSEENQILINDMIHQLISFIYNGHKSSSHNKHFVQDRSWFLQNEDMLKEWCKSPYVSDMNKQTIMYLIVRTKFAAQTPEPLTILPQSDLSTSGLERANLSTRQSLELAITEIEQDPIFKNNRGRTATAWKKKDLNAKVMDIIEKKAKGYVAANGKYYPPDMQWFADNAQKLGQWQNNTVLTKQTKNAIAAALMTSKEKVKPEVKPEVELQQILNLKLDPKTFYAQRLHGSRPIKYKDNDYQQITSQVDWVHPTHTRLVSLGSTLEDRERLFIDLNSPFINALKQRVLTDATSKPEISVFEVMTYVNERINQATDLPGKSRDEVEKELDGKLDAYVQALSTNRDGTKDCTIDMLANEKILVCRHKAALAAALLGSLVEKGVLPPGHVHQYRSELRGETGPLGGHGWAVYREAGSNRLWLCDPRWETVLPVTPPDYPGLDGYGKVALNDMVTRLDALDGVSTIEAANLVKGLITPKQEAPKQEAQPIAKAKTAPAVQTPPPAKAPAAKRPLPTPPVAKGAAAKVAAAKLQPSPVAAKVDQLSHLQQFKDVDIQQFHAVNKDENQNKENRGKILHQQQRLKREDIDKYRQEQKKDKPSPPPAAPPKMKGS